MEPEELAELLLGGQAEEQVIALAERRTIEERLDVIERTLAQLVRAVKMYVAPEERSGAGISLTVTERDGQDRILKVKIQ